MQSALGPPRGILNPHTGAEKFALTRHAPAADLAYFVERYWIIRWDLTDQPPYTQVTLPYPCVNMVIEGPTARIYGISTHRFTRELEGRGQVLGVKFRPGAFFPFINYPVAWLTNQSLDITEVFGEDACALAAEISGLETTQARLNRMETFLRAHLPAPDANIQLVNDIIGYIVTQERMLRVEEVAQQFGISRRTLQRLFHQCVGVTPKWVVQRLRLQAAAEQLAEGTADWSALAQNLGYFDQAHFIKDFKAVIGQTPAEYARQVSGG